MLCRVHVIHQEVIGQLWQIEANTTGYPLDSKRVIPRSPLLESGTATIILRTRLTTSSFL